MQTSQSLCQIGGVFYAESTKHMLRVRATRLMMAADERERNIVVVGKLDL